MDKEEIVKRIEELNTKINATITRAMMLTPDEEQELNRYFTEMEELKFKLKSEDGVK